MEHPADKRTAALARLQAGEGVRQVARELGVPKSTVADWKRRFSEGKTGCMVAFFLPIDAARQLALNADEVDGEVEPVEDLHLTLAFLGDSGGINDPDRLRRVVAGFAALAPPLEGKVSGVGMFAGTKAVVYASFDSPQLPEWRQRLAQHLRMAGYSPNTEHGFSPHITLAYATGETKLEAQPLTLAFDSLTLALGDDRYDWPLEGSAALFAESPRQPSKDAPEAPEPQLAGQPGVKPSKGVVLAPEGQAEPPPPIMDTLLALAYRRYFNLLANGVPHYAALHAGQQIDPDFEVTDEQGIRAIHALGKGKEPVLFANWSAGKIAPPDYVQAVYEQYRYGGQQIATLADSLYQQSSEVYLEGINAQLLGLGRPIATQVTDPSVLSGLRDEAQQVAEQIATTYDRELGGEVYTAWVELSAERGTQMSRYWLEEAMGRWAASRADWKAMQVATSEVGRWWNRGTLDFMSRNREAGMLVVEKVDIEPSAAECPKCVELLDEAPYNPDDPRLMDIPLHPNCQHFASPVMVPAEGVSLADLWTAQGGDVMTPEGEMAV